MHTSGKGGKSVCNNQKCELIIAVLLGIFRVAVLQVGIIGGFRIHIDGGSFFFDTGRVIFTQINMYTLIGVFIEVMVI